MQSMQCTLSRLASNGMIASRSFSLLLLLLASRAAANCELRQNAAERSDVRCERHRQGASIIIVVVDGQTNYVLFD